MPCYHPITAFQSGIGAKVKFKMGRSTTRQLSIPCGQCIGCKLETSRQWATRCMHEAQLHKHNECVLLTYAEMPTSGSLSHRDFQLFMKSLRTKHKNVSYYMCGEYGERTRRPHFHAALFNLELTDRKYHKTNRQGTRIFTSELLQKHWPHGYATTSALTFEAAAYIARYLVQKQTGPKAKAAYTVLDPSTGEITELTPEYNKMSLRPAIGKRWLEKYYTEVYPEGQVFVRGSLHAAPRYYDKQFREQQPELYDKLKAERALKAEDKYPDNTPERLNVKEAVATARAKLLTRNV